MSTSFLGRPFADMFNTEQAPKAPICSVILMGNPGAGKSALLNALGGDFYSGFYSIVGNPGSSKATVTIDQKTLELIDLPGISDAGGKGAISRNLQLLEDSLNSCSQALLFFVIKPNNGRISPEDFAVLKTLLLNLTKSPIIGLFVTQVREDHISRIDNDGYRDSVIQMLREHGANTCHLEKNRWSVLKLHQAEGFSEDEKAAIRKYVCSFVPAKVKVSNLIVRAFLEVLAYFKKHFG
ncbi:hypothetical protein F5H01DRAFT_408834 [Linnemannia elongata]|nr:hypothetical protein F5H01DRAFT_408834 [Linnemannia elongata]